MKYIVIVGDGMGDEPLEELGGQTPLEYAETPNMDMIATEGACGMMKTVPEGFEPGSDIANLSILGYDPGRYHTGRGPLEAASMGIELAEDDIAYRCNLVTIEGGIMIDFTSGHISGEEGARLISALSESAGGGVSLYPGVSYRNLLVVHHAEGAETTPPHDIVGEAVAPYLPRGGDACVLKELMERSKGVFSGHPVNQARRGAGRRPATMIWPWGGGRRPALPSFMERYGLSAGMISAVDLLRGIGRLAGMEVIDVPGATGFLDTDYQAKAEHAIRAIGRHDFVYLHVEAPDEASHMGSIREKVRAIERIDEMLGTIMAGFDGVIAVLTDHCTPIRLRTHTSDPVPFAVRGLWHDGCSRFSERAAEKGALGLISALDLLPMMLKGRN